MTNQEFSDSFTTLLNSYGTQAQFGDQASRQEIVLDEYEKSVLLTQAQDIIVKSYYDRTLNQQGQGFDDSTRRQVDFSSLIKVAELAAVNNPSDSFDDRGVVFQMPRRNSVTYSRSESSGTITETYTATSTSAGHDNTDVLFILNEKLRLLNIADTTDVTVKEYVIKPISYSEYDRIMSKPFAKPLKKQAWRLFQNQSTGFDVMTELIPRDKLPEDTSEETYEWSYKIRYVSRPTPIVLEDLPDGLDIDGYTSELPCMLNPILHWDILSKAVELAMATRGGYAVQNNQNQQQR